MDRRELAWAAGFWDGEGSAWLTRPKGRRAAQPQARINQASSSGVPDVLARFRAVVGVGSISGPEMREGRAPIYKWVASRRGDIVSTYDVIGTWLGPVKQRQFARVLGIDERVDQVAADLEEALAWAAGLFDGEGSVYLARHRSHVGYVRLEAAITQSDAEGMPAVLTRFRNVTGLGFAKGPYPASEGHDPVYRWKLYRRVQIERMIDLLRPWLGSVKLAQADHAISRVSAQSPLPRGNPAWGDHKKYCVNGHAYATARVRPFRGRGVNTDPPRASHQCLVCVRDGARRRRVERESENGGSRCSY